MHKAIRDVLKQACRSRKKAYPKSMTSKEAFTWAKKHPEDLRWFIRKIDYAEGAVFRTIPFGGFMDVYRKRAIRRVREWAKANGVKL